MDVSLVREFGKKVQLSVEDVDRILARFGNSDIVTDLNNSFLEDVFLSRNAMIRMRNCLAEKGTEFAPADLYSIIALLCYMRMLLWQEKESDTNGV